MSRRRDQGFGLVAAVAAVAAFACIAFEVLAANRGALAGANAQFETATNDVLSPSEVVLSHAGREQT